MSNSTPFTPPDWSLVPNHTAIILIDLQNDVLANDGWYAKSGVDITHMQRVIEPTKKLLAGAREKSVPVIWTTHGLHNEIDAGVFWDTRPFLHGGGFRVGSWGHGVYDEYEVLPDEWLVDKRRLSAFFNTELETIMRALAIETVMVSGVLTNQCVAGTIKDAMYRDYKTIMIEDCCGTTVPDLHEPAVKMCEMGWGAVWSLETALDGLKQLPIPSTQVA
ncbi:MAG: cysteine hydrolase [Pseudomonadota bacterium]